MSTQSKPYTASATMSSDAPGATRAMVSRAGYTLILVVVVAAAISVFLVLRPAGNSHELDAQTIVNYARYGVIDRIDANGGTVTVHFRESFDTKGAFGTSSHTFTSTLPNASSIVEMLQQAGIPINTASGVQLSLQ
jgi:hypothetical protein